MSHYPRNLMPRNGDGRCSNGRPKLTSDDVAAIRGHRRAGVSAAEIAALWGIHRSRVYQLLRTEAPK